MAAVPRFFIDVGGLPSGFGGLCQVTTLAALYALSIFVATKYGLLNGLRGLLLFRHANVVYHAALPLASVFPCLAMVAASGVGLATADGMDDIGMGLLTGSTVASLSLFWFAAVFCGRVTLDNGDSDGQPRYDAAAKLVPPGSLDLTGTGVAVSPRAQLGAQVAPSVLCGAADTTYSPTAPAPARLPLGLSFTSLPTHS